MNNSCGHIKCPTCNPKDSKIIIEEVFLPALCLNCGNYQDWDGNWYNQQHERIEPSGD